jgi:protein-disulfide isomerase
MIHFLFAAAVAAAGAGNLDEVLATVDGVAITRRDVQAALGERTRREYDEAADDLRDVERSAVRDYAGRQCIAAEAQQKKVTIDAVYARELAEHYGSFDANMRNRIEQQRERIFNAERITLDELIRTRLLEKAARARKVTVDELLAADVAPVTKSDIDFILAYENSKARVSESVPPGPQRLQAAIREARLQQKRDAVIESLRSSAAIDVRLAPPRVALSTSNAAVAGSPNAPVKVVVFTDFECQYCREAETSLVRLRQQYGDRLAVYYRNYPLPNHLYARPAAIAALCAADQGRYLEMHDFLFAHQSELANADYPRWAETIGLDRSKFEHCRASAATDARVNADIRDGVAAGVSGTPAFFVNGRLVRDVGQLSAVVGEEARR